jgi:eukaryotic-like serine/threonine-protein kinase
MKSLWIWPFELEEKIGEGGMGVVYRGRYVKNNRRVAVKLLPEDVADDIILKRFEREVELLKTLRHPNIVHSFGGVCEDKRRFYAMELVEGGSLDTLLRSRGGSLPWERVIELGVQMCAALQYAHEMGVVHRDIKPGNFLLTKDGQVKLGDFGLATVIAGNKLTASGKTVGSFRYMAPEQVRGKPDPVPQTDLYGLGCVLFLMLAGRPPFDGATAAELLQKQLEARPPRVTEFAADCPLSLERLIDSMLRKSIDERPQSAAVVAQALRSVTLTTVASVSSRSPALDVTRDARTIPELPSEVAPKRAAPRWLTWSLVGAVVVLLAVCGYLFNRNRQLAEAEQLWIDAYQNGDRETQIKAAEALGKLAQRSKRALRTLDEGLSTGPARRRVATIEALGNTGAAGRPHIERLMGLERNEEDPQIRYAAAESLKKLREAPESSFSWMTAFFWLIVAGCLAGGYIYWRKLQTATG